MLFLKEWKALCNFKISWFGTYEIMFLWMEKNAKIDKKIFLKVY